MVVEEYAFFGFQTRAGIYRHVGASIEVSYPVDKMAIDYLGLCVAPRLWSYTQQFFLVVLCLPENGTSLWLLNTRL